MSLPALLVLAAAPAAAPIDVPFRVGENAIIVDAIVNKRKLSFMFDTGFSGAIVINSEVNIGKPTGKMTLRDFVGQFQADTVKISSLMLGPIDVHDEEMSAVMMPSGRQSFSYNAHVDGIMGFEVIRKRVTEINFVQKKFIFHPNTIDISKRTPDNTNTFLLKMLPKGNSSIELEAVAPNGKRMTLALDTGNAFYATTHKDVLERVGLWKPEQKPKYLSSAFVASGEVTTWSKKMEGMSIFGVPVATSYWDIIDLPSSTADHDGTVGFQFLKNFNIIIDFERRRVWMEKHAATVANQPTAEIGATMAFDRQIGRVRVYRVAPASPADKAGIKKGDHVLSIDGKDGLEKMSYRRIDAMLEGIKGTKVKLTLSRGGQLMRHELEREHLYND